MCAKVIYYANSLLCHNPVSWNEKFRWAGFFMSPLLPVARHNPMHSSPVASKRQIPGPLFRGVSQFPRQLCPDTLNGKGSKQPQKHVMLRPSPRVGFQHATALFIRAEGV